jgi:hypothetical protein
MSTIIKYFVCETDEYEEPRHPNVLRIPKTVEQLQLRDIRDRFGDIKGGLRFYFKTVLEGDKEDNFVWEYLHDDNIFVPHINTQITMKVVRTGFKQFFEIKSRDKEFTFNTRSTGSMFTLFDTQFRNILRL